MGESLAARHVGAVTQLSPDAVLDAVVHLKTAKVNMLRHLKRMGVFYVIRLMTFRASTTLNK